MFPSKTTDVQSREIPTSRTVGSMTSTFGTLMLVFVAVILVACGAEKRGDDAIDPSKAACRAVLKGRGSPIFNLAWSPDGRTLASSGFGPVIRLWEPGTGRLSSLEGGTEQPRFVLAWAPQGRELIVGGLDVTVEAWDVDAGRRVVAGGWTGNRSAEVRELAGSRRGGTVRLWGPTDCRASVLPPLARSSNSLALAPGGRSVASGGADGILTIWDLESGREVRSFRGDRGSINSVAFSPDSSKVAAGGFGPVSVWDTVSGRELAMVGDARGGSATFAFSPDGRSLAIAFWDGSIRIWELSTGRERARLRGHDGQVLALAWAPEGKRLASGGYDSAVRVWDVGSAVEACSVD